MILRSAAIAFSSRKKLAMIDSEETLHAQASEEENERSGAGASPEGIRPRIDIAFHFRRCGACQTQRSHEAIPVFYANGCTSSDQFGAF